MCHLGPDNSRPGERRSEHPDEGRGGGREEGGAEEGDVREALAVKWRGPGVAEERTGEEEGEPHHLGHLLTACD